MESLSYIYDGILILLGIISLGISLRCIKIIIEEAVVKGEWLKALMSLRVRIFALVCAVSLLGTLAYIKNIYQSSADSYVEYDDYDDGRSTIHTSPGDREHGGGGREF